MSLPAPKKLFYVFSIDYQLISHRQAVVKAAIDAGYEVTVVAQDTGYRREIEGLGCRFVDLPINRVGTNIKEELATLRFLHNLYRKETPDIIHHVSLKIVLWGGLAAKLAGAKAVVNAVNGLGVLFATGEADSLMKKGILRVIRYSNSRKRVKTIFQNTDDRDFFLRNKALRTEQIEMISGSGVDLKDFAYQEPVAKERLMLALTSRMVKEKGVVEIVEAAKLLKEKYKDKIQFWLCGLLESNPEAVSEEYINKECDGEYIVFKGFCKDVKSVLTEADIVLLPSYYREGIPRSLIEATAIGRPIITTDWTGCRETVEDGVNGFLIPIKSSTELADRISRLVEDKELRLRMGRESRRVAESKFSLDNVIDRHLQIYKSLL